MISENWDSLNNINDMEDKFDYFYNSFLFLNIASPVKSLKINGNNKIKDNNNKIIISRQKLKLYFQNNKLLNDKLFKEFD